MCPSRVYSVFQISIVRYPLLKSVSTDCAFESMSYKKVIPIYQTIAS